MRDPDLSGVARVWRVRLTPENVAAHTADWGYEPSSLADWIVNGPYHPFWSWWYIGVVHLREVAGAPPPNRRYPAAEYEIMCLSLNPDGEPGRPKIPDLDKLEAGDITGGLPGFLTPADWVVQFDGCTDEQAVEVGTLAVTAISHGQSCDSDFRSWWEKAIPNTVKHVLGVPH